MRAPGSTNRPRSVAGSVLTTCGVFRLVQNDGLSRISAQVDTALREGYILVRMVRLGLQRVSRNKGQIKVTPHCFFWGEAGMAELLQGIPECSGELQISLARHVEAVGITSSFGSCAGEFRFAWPGARPKCDQFRRNNVIRLKATPHRGFVELISGLNRYVPCSPRTTPHDEFR
jgi:hypothetical protein